MTLLDAFTVLKDIQAGFNQKRFLHRAALVVDEELRFVGKLSQHDAIEALEPNYKGMRDTMGRGSIHRFGFSHDFIMSTIEQYGLWEKALDNLCEKAMSLKVREIMYRLDEVELVTSGATMDEAIHRMIIGQHHSLLVTSDIDQSEMVGVLRLTDVFAFVGESMQACLPE
jgi:hypothetical protein